MLTFCPCPCACACVCPSVRLHGAVFKISWWKFYGRCISILSRGTFFGFWKKFQKRKKISKKPLKNLKNPVEKEQFKTDFQYLWRFGNFWSVEKNIFFGFFKKVIFGLFRAILNFLVSVKNGGDQDFLYFVPIDEIS